MSLIEEAIERPKFTGKIRPLVGSDLEQVKRIILTRFVNPIQRDEILPIADTFIDAISDSLNQNNDHKYFVAEENGTVVGFIGMIPLAEKMKRFSQTKSPIELEPCLVAKGQRGGRGIGTALVQALEYEAKKAGYKEILLKSGVLFQRKGWGFWDKFPGYEQVGQLNDFYKEGPSGVAIVWRKTL